MGRRRKKKPATTACKPGPKPLPEYWRLEIGFCIHVEAERLAPFALAEQRYHSNKHVKSQKADIAKDIERAVRKLSPEDAALRQSTLAKTDALGVSEADIKMFGRPAVFAILERAGRRAFGEIPPSTKRRRRASGRRQSRRIILAPTSSPRRMPRRMPQEWTWDLPVEFVYDPDMGPIEHVFDCVRTMFEPVLLELGYRRGLGETSLNAYWKAYRRNKNQLMTYSMSREQSLLALAKQARLK